MESDIQKTILHYLRVRNVFAWRQNQGAMPTEYRGRKRLIRFSYAKGVSDIIGVLPGGKFLALEVKQPGNKPTPDQQDFLDRVNAEGGVAACVTSLDDVVRLLEDATR